MYVLSAERVLTLERLPTHEEIMSELVEWNKTMPTLFVSQTWLTYGHPDNSSNIKLNSLKSFLRNAVNGKKPILPTWELELVWGKDCLLYTSPSPRDLSTSRMPSSA